jgi:hypothetical protein
MRRGRILSAAAAAGAVVLLITAAAALATSGHKGFTKNATDQGYGGVTNVTPTTPSASGGVSNQSSQPTSGGVAGRQHALGGSNGSGALPFTGAQLAVFVAIGFALLGGGALLRRAGRGRSRP